MNKYLLEKEKELKNKQFTDADIDDILFVTCAENEDDIIKIIVKYIFRKDDFFIDDNEVTVLLNELEYEYHILIKTVLHYFVACSKEIERSKLVDCCREYIINYFNNIDSVNNVVPQYNLSRIIDWTIEKFPQCKKEISKLLFEKIYNGSISNINYLELIDYFMSHEKKSTIFTAAQYESFFDKYFVKMNNSEYVYLYLDYYDKYYEYILNNNKKMKKEFSKKYCDFVITNIELIDNYKKQILLQKIRNIMDALGCYKDEDYYILDKNLEYANKSTLKSLKMHGICLPQGHTEVLNNYIESQNNIFSKLNNVEMLEKLLFDLEPISKQDIKDDIEKRKGTASLFFKNRFLDYEGRIINYQNLATEQMFSLNATQFVSDFINFTFKILITPFYTHFSIDDDVKKFISSIMGNNKLISNDRIENMTIDFINLLKKDFRNSVYNIIPEFEESLRFYFKNLGMNIYKKNGKHDYIGLSDIFNDNNNNLFRDELLKIINEDYYFILKWILTDHYGYGIKYIESHRYGSPKSYNTEYSIYISFMILRLYWWGNMLAL